MKKTMPKEILYRKDSGRFVYGADADQVAFLLGGIGTGNISVGSRGELKDWEIFNWPGKNTKFPFSFFAMRVAGESLEKPICRVLESRRHPPYTSSHGYLQSQVMNLPRFEDSVMTCRMPFVNVKLLDSGVPVDVEMEAFTPFVPLDADASSIPACIIRYRVRNRSDRPLDVSVVGSMANACGFEGYDVIENLKLADSVHNSFVESSSYHGLYYEPDTLSPDHLRYGNMSILTTDPDYTCKREWFDGQWVDGAQDFWDDFSSDGRLEMETRSDTIGCEFAEFHKNFSFLVRKEKIGSVGACRCLMPGEEHVFEFVISWYFPNRVKAWIEFDEDYEDFRNGKYGTARNYYSTKFANALEAAGYLIDNLGYLEEQSRAFEKAMFEETTLPDYVVDAVTANITAMRSQLCFRLEDGTFCGFEGIRDYIGCGYGSVPHVWNYEQTVAFLFPELEKTMKRVEFLKETNPDGRMNTRMFSVFEQEPYEMVPACDGQLGAIIGWFRDFRNTGDIEYLRSLWPSVVKSIDYAISYWDKDGDFVLDGQQNTTYDIEFYGPNPMTQIMFLAALSCCAEAAKVLGDEERAVYYQDGFEKGRKRTDEMLFNGEYYQQLAGDDLEKYRYQYGKGCLSDQLFGQFLYFMAGFGSILPEEHVKKAIKSVFDFNFRTQFFDAENVHRAYALNAEQGLVTATWPRGGRPRFPLSYAGEVWTGIEYQVAATLIYCGYLDEGLTMVHAIRDRYDGYKRNPFSEVESGHHYARAMASWGVYNALTGFRQDAHEGCFSFDPKIDAEDFSCFFVAGNAWGVYRQRKDGERIERSVEVLHGSLDGMELK